MAEDPTVKIFVGQHLIPIEGPILSPGALAIRGGKIIELGDPEVLKEKFPTAEVEEFSSQTILPGLVNAHADLSVTSLSSQNPQAFPRPENGLFMPWLVQLSRYKARLSIAEQQMALRRGLKELKASGVTTVGDKCRYPIALSLYEESQLRVVCLAEIENIQRPLAQDEFEQALALVDEIQHQQNEKISAGLAPFSAYTLSKNLLKIIADHALQQELPLHLHAAMSFSEMEFFYDSMGEITSVLFKEAGWKDEIPHPHRMTPVQYLHEIGFLRAKASLIGCLHLGPTDAAILENQECQRVFSPQAFQSLGLGEIPWNKIFQKKTPWALASLGEKWGSNLNLWEEMRLILHHTNEDLRELAAEQILRAVTLGGAKALGLEEGVGSLGPGKDADFIVVSTPHGEGTLVSNLIEKTLRDGVLASFVGGDRIL